MFVLATALTMSHMHPESSSDRTEPILPELYPALSKPYTQGFPLDDDDLGETASPCASLSQPHSLPRRIIDLVDERRSCQHDSSQIVTAVWHLLRRLMKPIHREMYRSNIVSVRSNAKIFRAIYTNKDLASKIHQAAHDGAKTLDMRLAAIARLIFARLGHILGLLKTVKKELHDRLVRMIGAEAFA